MKNKILRIIMANLLMFIVFACRNGIGAKEEDEEGSEEGVEEIELQLKGDKYVEISDDVFTIKKGTKWKEIKDEISERLSFEDGYLLNRWKLGSSSRGKALSDNYVFKKGGNIYATSKKHSTSKKEKSKKGKHPKSKTGKETTVMLSLNGGENVILEYYALEVPKGASWQELRETEYICSTQAQSGYYLSEWKLEDDENSADIEDDYIFEQNESLYIFAFKDEEGGQENEYVGNYTPAIPKDAEIEDGGLIDVEPPLEKIISPPIDYPLPNSPEKLSPKLWQGVFSSENAIEIKPFRLGKYEVTYRLWTEIYDWACAHGYEFANRGNCGSGSSVSSRHPVVMVSWCDAIVWCNAYTEKLGMSDAFVYLKKSDETVIKDVKDAKVPNHILIDVSKKGFRLPLETEWEYAARKEKEGAPNTIEISGSYFTKLNTTSGSTLPLSSRNSELQSFAAMNKELFSTTVCFKYFDGIGYKRFEPPVLGTAPCASKRANHLGFYDMSGNVEELCALPTKEAIFGNKVEKSACCVARGGSWECFSYDCIVGRRQCWAIEETWSALGFRLCQTK